MGGASDRSSSNTSNAHRARARAPRCILHMYMCMNMRAEQVMTELYSPLAMRTIFINTHTSGTAYPTLPTRYLRTLYTQAHLLYLPYRRRST